MVVSMGTASSLTSAPQDITCSHAGTYPLARKISLYGRRATVHRRAAADDSAAGARVGVGRSRMRRRAPPSAPGPSNTIAVPDLAGQKEYSPYRRTARQEPDFSNQRPGRAGQDLQPAEQPGSSSFGEANGDQNARQWGLAAPEPGSRPHSGRDPRPASSRQGGRRAPAAWTGRQDRLDHKDTLDWGDSSTTPGALREQGTPQRHAPPVGSSSGFAQDQPSKSWQSRSELSPAGDRPSSRGAHSDAWGSAAAPRNWGYRESQTARTSDPWVSASGGRDRSAGGVGYAGSSRRTAVAKADGWGSLEGVPERGHANEYNSSIDRPGQRIGVPTFDGQGPQEERRKPYISRQERVRLMLQSNSDIKAAYEDLTAALAESSVAKDRALALQDFLAELTAIVESGEDHFDPVNISTAFYQMATALSDCSSCCTADTAAATGDLSHRLVTMSLSQVKDFKIGAVFNTVSSLAKLASLNQEAFLGRLAGEDAALLGTLLEGLAKRALMRFREPPSPEPQYLAGLLWAYGKLGVNPLGGRLFATVLAVSEPVLEAFAPQNLSNLLVAAENLREPLPDAFMQRLAQQVVLKMPEAAPQGVSNSLWAFAKLTGTSPLQGDLFRAGFSRALEDSKRFNIQNVANLLWAAATVGTPVGRAVLDSLAQAAIADMASAVPQNLSNLLWACAKLGVSPLNGSLVEAALSKADQLLPRLSRQELSNSLWALGHLEHTVPSRMLQRLNGSWAERALVLLSDESEGQREGWAQNVGNIMWAYSRLHLDPLQGRLAARVGELVESRVSEFTTQNLSNLLLSAAVVQRQSFSPAALDSMCSVIASKGNRQEVCNAMWSLAALGVLNQALLQRFAARLSELEAHATLSLAEAKQLLLAQVAVQLSASDSSAEGALLPEALTASARQMVLELKKEPRISEFHEQVSAVLKSMRIPHAIEFVSPDGMFSIDIVAKAGDGAPLAIEVDGAHHFTALPPFRPLGSTVLRNRLLSGKGFRGLGVPFYDWDRLKGEQERRRYLEARLAKHGIVPQKSKQALETV